MKWQQKAATSKEPDDCFDIQDSEIGLCCQIIWLNTLNRRFHLFLQQASNYSQFSAQVTTPANSMIDSGM